MVDANPPPPSRTFTVEVATGTIACSAWDTDEGVDAVAPALLVHGVNGSISSWATVIATVAGRRPLVAVDLRGRGASSTEGPWGVGAHADDLVAVAAAVVDADGTDPLTLVGHSFGAHVAACAAARSPELVGDLLLVDGGPPRSIPDDGPDAVIDGALANIIPGLDGLPYPVSAEAVTADFRSMVVDPEATESLTATKHPLTLIRAEHGVAPGLPPIIDDEVLAAVVDHEPFRPVTSMVVGAATHFSLLDEHAIAVVQPLLLPTKGL